MATREDANLERDKKIQVLYDALKTDGADVGTSQEFNDWFLRPGDEGYKNRMTVWEAFKADGADVGESYEEFRDWLFPLNAAQKQKQQTMSAPATGAEAPAQASSEVPQSEGATQGEQEGAMSGMDAAGYGAQSVAGEEGVKDYEFFPWAANGSLWVDRGGQTYLVPISNIGKGINDLQKWASMYDDRDLKVSVHSPEGDHRWVGVDEAAALTNDGWHVGGRSGDRLYGDEDKYGTLDIYSRGYKVRRGGKDFYIPYADAELYGGLEGWEKAHPGAELRVYMIDPDGKEKHVSVSQSKQRSDVLKWKFVKGDIESSSAREAYTPLEREKNVLYINMRVGGENVLVSADEINEFKGPAGWAYAHQKEGVSVVMMKPDGSKVYVPVKEVADRIGKGYKYVGKNGELDGSAALYRSISSLWKEAEDNIRNDKERNANTHWGNQAMIGGKEMRMVNAGMNAYDDMVSSFTHKDIQTLMDKAWKDKGQLLKEEIYANLRQKHPKASDAELWNQAGIWARQVSDSIVYEYVKSKNVPQNALEFFVGRVLSANSIASIMQGIARIGAKGKTGDMAARDDAWNTYGKNHRVADTLGMATGVTTDPVTVLSTGVGNIMAKGALSLGGRFVFGKGGQIGARLMQTTKAGKYLGAIAGGAGNFTTFETLGNLVEQFKWGGWINPETGENEGYNFWETGKSAIKGALTGGVMGVGGHFWGNVGRSGVRSATSTAGKIGVKAGMGVASLATETGVFAASHLLFGNGEEDVVDALTDAGATVLGFKGVHLPKTIMHGREVIRGLRPVNPADGRELTLEERNQNRMGFVERLNRMLDGVDEKDIHEAVKEIKSKGYKDLGDLFTKKESDKKRARIAGNVEFDGYEELSALINDNEVSFETRALLYSVFTGGRMAMVPTIVDYRETREADGSVTLETLSSDGLVVNRRNFSNEKDVNNYRNSIERQVELNGIDLGEREADNRAFMQLFNYAAEELGENPQVAMELYRKIKNGEEVGEGYADFAERIEEVMKRESPNAQGMTSAGLRAMIENEYGVDIGDVIRKFEGRTEEEQEALEAYLKALYPEMAQREEMEELAKLSYDAGVRAYNENPGTEGPRGGGEEILNRYRNALEEIGEAFSEEPEYWESRIAEDPFGVLSEPDLTDEQRGVVAAYINARSAFEGYSAALDKGYEGKLAQGEAELEQRRNKDHGGIQQVQMKVGEELVYLIKGKVEMLPDGSGIDLGKSSKEIVILDPADGELKMISPERLKQAFETTPYEEELAAIKDRIEAEKEVEVSELTRGMDREEEGEISPDDKPRTGDSESGGISPDDKPSGDAPEGGMERGKGLTHNEAEGKARGEEAAASDEVSERGVRVRTRGEAEDPKKFDNGYQEGEKEIEGKSEEWIQDKLDTLLPDSERLTDWGSGYTKALEDGLAKRRKEETDRREPKGPNKDALPIKGDEGPIERGEIVEGSIDETPEIKMESTALERIPVDEKTGEPDFEKAPDHETAWDGLVEAAKGNEELAARVAEATLKQANLELSALEKRAPKRRKTELKGTPLQMLAVEEEAEKEYQKELERHNGELEALRRKVATWKGISGVMGAREIAAKRAEEKAREVEQKKREEERRIREAEQQEREREERELLQGVPDWSQDTPSDARARGYRRNGPEKVDRPPVIEEPILGKETEVRFADKVIQKGRMGIVDISQAQPSHIDRMRNPRHFLDEAQPKERTDEASDIAATKMARDMRPEEITQGATAYTGAPSINTRGEAIQGNNRVRALKLMYESYPESAERYKQYLTEHAEEFGLTAEDIKRVEKPILVNIFDVSDEEAIKLGQHTADETESGGIERIKPKNTLQKMGEKVGSFSNILLRSVDDEASISQLLDSNGVEVLKWMHDRGYITDTQYQSAFDSRGELSGDAKNDLKGILFQSVFQGGSTRLEEMFNRMPAKAQRAILATAHRDVESSNEERMTAEIQQSIMAFEALMGYAPFAEATSAEATQIAVEDWKVQYAFDDVTGESYLPSETFSNFALALASLYKSSTQKTIQGVFNAMYDIIQGKKRATLFEEGDETPRSLGEAIREVLDIDYKPIKIKENDREIGSAVLDGDNKRGEERERGGSGDTGGSESPSGKEGRTDDRGGADRDNEEAERGGRSEERSGTENPLGGTGDNSIDEWFGPVYTQFEGKATEAEEYLRETNKGIAKGALRYPGVAPIDIAWGDMKAGYMKIVIRHPEVVGKLQEILSDTKIKEQSDNRIVFESDTHRMIVSKMKGATPTDNWLLTAYEKNKKFVSASSSDIETEPKGKRNGTATPQNELSKGKGSEKVGEEQIAPEDKPKLPTEEEVKRRREGRRDSGREQGIIDTAGLNEREIEYEIKKAERYGKEWDESYDEGYIEGLKEGLERVKAELEQKKSDPMYGAIYRGIERARRAHRDEYSYSNEEEKRARRRDYEEAIAQTDREFERLTDDELKVLAGQDSRLRAEFELGGSLYLSQTRNRLQEIEFSDKNRELLRSVEELPDVRAGARSRKLKLTDFTAGKKDNRETLKGVYHDEELGMAVATDTVVIIGDKSGYDATLAGKTVDATGNEIAGRYPPLKKILRQTKPLQEVNLEAQSAERIAMRLRAAMKGIKKADLDSMNIAVEFGKDKVGMYSIVPLAKFFEGMAMIGGRRVEFFGSQIPLFSNEEQGIVAVMPREGMPSYKLKLSDYGGVSSEATTAEEPKAKYRSGKTAGEARLHEGPNNTRQRTIFDLIEEEEAKERLETTARSLEKREGEDIFEQAERISQAEQALRLAERDKAKDEAAEETDNAIDEFIDAYARYRERCRELDFEREEAESLALKEPEEKGVKERISELDAEEKELDEEMGEKRRVLEEKVADYYKTHEGEERPEESARAMVEKLLIDADVSLRRRWGRDRWEPQTNKSRDGAGTTMESLIDFDGVGLEERGAMALESAAMEVHRIQEVMSERYVDYKEKLDTLYNEKEEWEKRKETLKSELEELSDRGLEDSDDYLEKQTELEDMGTELDWDVKEQRIEEEFLPHKEAFESAAREYYGLNNTKDDAEAQARELTARALAEIEIRLGEKRAVVTLGELLGADGEIVSSREAQEGIKSGETKTAGGVIHYEGKGHLPNSEQGEFAYAERVFTLSGHYSFTGGEKIKDRGDVAFMFKALQTKGIENLFVVVVDKQGRPHVVHMSMGGTTATLFDVKTAKAAFEAFAGEQVYILHNHPSGNLTPSPQDMNMMEQTRKALGDDVAIEGLIIDTTSGKYANMYSSFYRRRRNETLADRGIETAQVPDGTGKEKGVDVYAFDETDRKIGQGLPSERSIIRSSRDVVDFIADRRFNPEERISYLVISQSGEIVGNFHSEHTDPMADEFAEEVTSAAIKHGGESVVVYGKVGTPDDIYEPLKTAIEDRGLRLLDVVGIKDGVATSKDERYPFVLKNGTTSPLPSTADLKAHLKAHGIKGKETVDFLLIGKDGKISEVYESDYKDYTSKQLAEDIVSTAEYVGAVAVVPFSSRRVYYEDPIDLKGNIERKGLRVLDILGVDENGISSQLVSWAREAEAGYGSSEAERYQRIQELEPIKVKQNKYTKSELRDIYNTLPAVTKDGHEVEFYHSAFKKIYKEGGLFRQIVPVLDQVLRHSMFAYSEPDNLGGTVRPDGTIHKQHPNVISFDNYVGKVEIAGKEYYVRTTVQKEKNDVGTHSFMVTDVDLYEKSSERLSLPITTRARGTNEGIVDAKLADFFERAKNNLEINEGSDSDVRFSIRREADPKKTGIGYKVFVLKDGKLYPPMVANPGGEATPVGVWLNADAAPVVGQSKTGRNQVKAGGKGTQGGSGKLAYRPGWHLGEIPYALQFNRKGESGARDRFPGNFVWAEVEYANDVDYQEEAMGYGTNPSGKFQHSLAGLPRVPKNGAYRYRTNPNPETDPWIITGAMRVKRLLTPSEVDRIVVEAGREPQRRQEGAVTDAQIEKLNTELGLTGASDREIVEAMTEMAKATGVPVEIVGSREALSQREKSTGNEHATESVVCGYTKDGKMYLNEDAMTPDTPLHEYTHLWDDVVRRENPELWKRGKELLKKTPLWEEVKNDPEYADIRDNEDAIASEVHSRISGEEGARTMEDMINRARKEGPIKVAETVSVVHRLKKWLSEMFKWLKKTLGKWSKRELEGLTLEEFNNMTLRDFAEGLDPNKEMRRGEAARIGRKAMKDAKARFQIRRGQEELKETIERMKAEAMQANADNLEAKREAMRAIGGNLNKLRRAMARQREYDITTVKSVTDLARTLMRNGLLDDISKFEIDRILGAVNNVVGRQDVRGQVQKVMDIMVENQLRAGRNDFSHMLRIRGSRVDARGIEVQGELDPDGLAIVKVIKKTYTLPKEEIENRISEALNRMGSSDQAIAYEAALEYSGLQIARRYAEEISESKAEEKALRDSIKEAKEDRDAGHMTDDAYKQYVASTEDAIRENKIERAEAYQSLIGQAGGILSDSIAKAREWRIGEVARVAEIHHNANSDMEGRPTDEHHKNGRLQKLANNSGLRFLFAPLGTFDQMLRMFGNKSARGEGYLWNRYMRGWVDATEREYTGYRDAVRELDAKVSEVFGKRGMKWRDLFSLDRKLPKGIVNFWDGGDYKDHELSQGNLLYIYMVDKMADGRMKLRKMGITEEDVREIEGILDPRFIELADWMQEEFLVEKRNEYNETHKRMFGASMAAIDNYFPLKILANARTEEIDVADDTGDTALPATSTSSIIKRRRNNLALDVTGANAFSVILDHLQQMERWNAFAEFNRDLNTLLSYKRFRNQVMNMSSVYGGGKTLWTNFRNVASMAAGAYRPPIAALDKTAVNIAKGVTAAKVSFRIFTALKQMLSMPAYLPDSNPKNLLKNLANPIGAWKWGMENLPIFEKRWWSRMAGDPRLMKTEMDWKAWRSNIVQLASRVGMSPNAFIDAMTVAIGARSMYETKRAKYLRWGMEEAEAEHRALQDATILFNQTQQSSESAFLSTVQVDRSWLSVLLTVFRNSSMSYSRKLYDAMRNLGRRLTPDYKGMSEEFMAKQMRRDGIDPDIAEKEAKREYKRGILRDLATVGIFGFGLQLAWNLGAYLPYLLLGDDEEQKDDMFEDAITHAMFGSIEGLAGGDAYSAALNQWSKGEFSLRGVAKDMPAVSDLEAIYEKLGKDKVEAMNDVINLLVQSSVGVNPQSLTDAVVAIIDYCGDDAQSQKECALLIARVVNCPQSQLDKVYFDEIDLTAREASRMTVEELAERFVRYKRLRGAPLTSWAYSGAERDSVDTKHRKKVEKTAKEKIEAVTDEGVGISTRKLDSIYKELNDRQKGISALKSQDERAWREATDDWHQTDIYQMYRVLKAYRSEIKALTEGWLKAPTTQERDAMAAAILHQKERLVKMAKSGNWNIEDWREGR